MTLSTWNLPELYVTHSPKKKSVCISIKEDSGNEYQWRLDTSESESEEVDYTYTGSDIHGLSLFDDRFIFLEAERWAPKPNITNRRLGHTILH